SVPDPVVSSSDAELRAHVERALSANYELDREIGRGGMGIVYKAKDKRLKRHVAVKLLPPELAFRGEIRSRFLKEAETAAQLSHPNIVPIYSVDERDGLVFFVMAYIDGENLGARLHTQGRLDPTETRRIMKEVAEALAYAHERGVVHRDIKPDNILLCSDDDGRVMVTDFGIARAVTEGADSRLTATGMAIGTPAYMSPEQSMGEREIDGRSDLYALGVVGYQMLSGELPFNATSTPALLVKQISERPTPVDVHRPDAPSDLARAVMMLLEKEPANRFPTADALVVALDTGNVPELPESSFRNEPNRFASMQVQGRDSRSMTGAADSDYGVVTREDEIRWDDPKVKDFRKKLAPFFAVSAVVTVLAIFGVLNLMGIVGIWSVYLAYQYAKLWTDGYDWRDVFKQPKDRLFFDVVAESIDDFRALFDKKKRDEVLVRDRLRARTSNRRLFGESSGRALATSEMPAASPARVSPTYMAKLRDAGRHREDILRLIDTLPKREREQVNEVPATADALYRRIELLAVDLTELERGFAADDGDKVEVEIEQLEAAANPMDPRSEERIRRLAILKRKRGSLRDLRKKRESQSARFENCVLALENMRYDVLKLKTGGQSYQQVTQLAERAMSLAQEVDNAVYVAEEMRKLGIRDSGVANRRTS
ncbi:MAG TPA: serine/threonine-protein kinase, partial [Gemmatimonadaceae bacterium]|nr:serine/threonine-protein kinase [Gemmatimonadaceae bacterium]